ncbi:MAG: alpha/beta hydrolase [Anaerolineales bacterium]
MEWNLPHTYDFDDRTIRYGVAGDGPALVIVHGTPWSSFNLRHLIKGLSDRYTVYYYDLMGYGQSDQQEGDVSLGVQNEILHSLITKEWKLSSPIAIGHDFGGATVLRTHLLSGAEFEKMVLIDPVAVAPWGSEFFAHVRKHESAFSGVPDYIQDAILRAYILSAAHEKLDEATLSETVRPWATGLGKAAFYRQIAQADQKYTDEVQALYSNIDLPVLILWGEEDVWIPIERGLELQKAIPQSQFFAVPDAGHLVIEEKPQELLKRIIPFLAG